MKTPSSPKFFLSWQVQTLVWLYALPVLWWVTIINRGLVGTPENHWFGIVFTIPPCIATVFALFRLYKLPSAAQQIFKRPVWLICLGFWLWAASTITYIYYNIVLDIETPYQSWADAGYILSNPVELIGVLILISRLHYSNKIKLIFKKAAFFILPTLFSAILFYFFLPQGNSQQILIVQKFLLDLSILLPEFLLIVVSLVLFYLLVFDKQKLPRRVMLLFLIGYLFLYTADLFYVYTNYIGVYYTTSWFDVFYLPALFFRNIGLLYFLEKLK